MTIHVEPAKIVVVQPETRGLSKKQALSEGIDSKAVGCRERILELLEGGVGGDGVSHVLCPLWLEVNTASASECNASFHE